MKRNYNRPQIRVIKVDMRSVLLGNSPEGKDVENIGQGEQGKPFDAKMDDDEDLW